MRSFYKELLESILLQEKMLHSEVTFGFELEAFVSHDQQYNDTNKVGTLLSTLYFDGGSVGGDSSIRPPGKNYYSFEYRSPPKAFGTANIMQFKKLLLSLEKYGIETNKSCGFHIHFGFPDLNTDLTKFVVMHVAANTGKIRQTINYLSDVEFFDKEHANEESLYSLLDMMKNDIESSDIETDKYTTFNLHSQGTLEWRGPRNFLDNKELIIKFIAHVHKFVSWMTYIVSKKPNVMVTLDDGSIKQIAYTDVFDKVRAKDKVLKITNDIVGRIIKVLETNPGKIINMKIDRVSVDAAPIHEAITKNALEVAKAINSKEGVLNANKYIRWNVIDDTRVLSLFLEKASEYLKSNAELQNTSDRIINIIKPSVDWDVPEDIVIKVYTRTKNIEILRLVKDMSETAQLEVVKQDGWAIRYIKNPSEKLQIEAVKQNAWAIRFIKNPSEAVQLEAVKQSEYVIKEIKNPTEKVKQLHKELWG